MEDLTPFGFNIVPDSNDMISLTDIWREANSDPQKTPAKWQETESCKSFIRAACRMLNIANGDIIKSTRGKGGGTKAHKQVAIEYAQYLDPKLAVALNQLFFQHVEEVKNPQLSIDKGKNAWRRQGKSEQWINIRILSTDERKTFTKALNNHGVTGSGYKDCTNAIYKHLWGGGADIIRIKKNIAEGTNCRDHMTEIELTGVRLAEMIAERYIEKEGVTGNSRVAAICERASQNVAKAILI